jgi:hypothetical protein
MASTSALLPHDALAGLPPKLRADLVGEFQKIVSNYAESRWEPAELSGGKLAEAAYCICEGIATGAFPAAATKPSNMVDACKKLEGHTGAPRSVRIQIPRMIVALYEIRNNRNVGHLGGDLDPSHMDAVCVLQMAKWIVAELVRVLHSLSIEEATAVVDALVEREVPLVWKVGGRRRVLDPDMRMPDKTLVLLHGVAGPAAEDELRSWVERPEARLYRRDVLRRLHAAKLVEYDPAAGTVEISPLGVARVEEKILKQAA